MHVHVQFQTSSLNVNIGVYQFIAVWWTQPWLCNTHWWRNLNLTNNPAVLTQEAAADGEKRREREGSIQILRLGWRRWNNDGTLPLKNVELIPPHRSFSGGAQSPSDRLQLPASVSLSALSPPPSLHLFRSLSRVLLLPLPPRASR